MAARFILVGFLMLVPGMAHAYIGPGAGISAFGSALALVAALLLAIVGFFWYPIKRLFFRRKSNTTCTSGDGRDEETSA